jgi:tripartite-type tricarboxylate transporter receptor subunit TctC
VYGHVESGLPGWAAHGVAVPAGTPPEIAQELNTMVNRIGGLPAVATRFAMLGLRFSRSPWRSWKRGGARIIQCSAR